jgi:pimeloyl-ACP methyl ester carboxylesterase
VVLLLHGWAGTAELNWSHAYGPLAAAGYRIIAVDLPGHGKGARDTPFTLEGTADAAAQLVRNSGVSKVVVVGHSMGGSIALLFAHRHPGLTAGLVLMATQAVWPGIPPRWLIRSAGHLAALAPKLVLCRGARSLLGSDLSRNYWINEELRGTSIRHLAEALAAMRQFDAKPWLADIRVPTVVLVTTLDTQVSPERQRRLAAAIPGAKVLDVAIDHSDPPSRPGLFPLRGPERGPSRPRRPSYDGLRSVRAQERGTLF